MSTQEPNAAARIRWIVDRLASVYGWPRWHKHGTGVASLVATILSQNTSDANSSAAFRSLTRRFPSWDDVLAARTSDVEQAIRQGGLAKTKAPRIQKMLRQIRSERGRLDLSFLARMQLDDARAYLESLDGIGPKTAACVLLFAYNRPALPVDTHVHRVARRLRLIPDHCSAEAAHEHLQRICPDALVYPFHVLMVWHGRRMCRPRKPACSQCPLRARCPSRAKFEHGAPAPAGHKSG